MAGIGVKELKATASAVIDEVEGGAAFVVTKRGKPAAVLLAIEDAEDIVLANADEYVRMRRDARAACRKGRSTGLGDLARPLPTRSGRRLGPRGCSRCWTPS